MLSWPAFLEQAPEHTEVHTNERTSFLQIRTWIRILSLFLFEWIWNWGLGSRSWCKFYLNFFGSWYFLLPFQYLEHSMLTVFSCRVGFFFFFSHSRYPRRVSLAFKLQNIPLKLKARTTVLRKKKAFWVSRAYVLWVSKNQNPMLNNRHRRICSLICENEVFFCHKKKKKKSHRLGRSSRGET